jgi:SnoaL-like domain
MDLRAGRVSTRILTIWKVWCTLLSRAMRAVTAPPAGGMTMAKVSGDGEAGRVNPAVAAAVVTPVNTRLGVDDQLAIMQLIHEFFWLVDHGRAGETAGLFTPTARLTFGPGAPQPGTIEGADIAAAMAARGQQVEVTTRHVLSNIRLTPKADGSVSAYSLLTLFRSDSTARDSYPASVADIEEMFVRDKGGWLIQQRTVLPIFSHS